MDWYIRVPDFDRFVEKLASKRRVIGPVAKGTKFVFGELKKALDLRLDYDVTILPPKKAFYPPKQNLIEFTASGFKNAIQPKNQILFGVHFYDVKAIDMLDKIYSDAPADQSYLEQRKRTTIVASNIQNISPRAFFGSACPELAPKGHDAFLTKLKDGYLFCVITAKGRALLKSGKFRKARPEEVKKAAEANKNVLSRCLEKQKHSSEAIATKARATYGNEKLWDDLSKKCFSCGTCNIVCPTCHCSDVQDDWNIDQVSGVRYRTWDGCLLHDFSHITLGAGGFHNPREKTSHRFRHRVMRKTAYLNEKLGGPGCVGCGRCSIGCVPDIADPVEIVKRMMES